MSINSEENSVQTGRGYCHKEHTLFYRWEITGITSLIEVGRAVEDNFRLISPKFSAGALINDVWHLQLQIDTDTAVTKNKSWISLYLHSDYDGKVRVKFKLFLLSSKREKVVRNFIVLIESSNQWFSDQIFTGKTGWDYKEFMKIDELLEKKKEFFSNDILIVGIDLIVYDYLETFDNTINSLANLDYYPLRKLADDFKNLLDIKKNCDVVIKVGGKNFDAHKFILSARSCVFEAMFSHNMVENKENEVNIPDIDPEVFEKVLDYIYTDKVDGLDDFAEELLEASDKYQLYGLKKLSTSSLCKTLSSENVVRILILADRHNVQILKESVIDYVISNFDKLKFTEEFKALEKSQPSLFLIILKKCLNVGTS